MGMRTKTTYIFLIIITISPPHFPFPCSLLPLLSVFVEGITSEVIILLTDLIKSRLAVLSGGIAAVWSQHQVSSSGRP